MKTLRFTILYLLLLSCVHVNADESIPSKYPVDLSFLIADLKYSKERGVKICEVQHGVLSVFRGDRFSYGKSGIIPENFYRAMKTYLGTLWTVKRDFSDPYLQMLFPKKKKWHVRSSYEGILRNKKFKKASQRPVSNPNSINSYHGFVHVRPGHSDDYATFRQKYPGVILVDAASHPFWTDKLKMMELFDKDHTLASFKPKWGVYPKPYSKGLAARIQSDIGSDIVVIKPRGAFKGDGVIIVHKDDLDATLKYILHDSPKLRDDPDPSYHYWLKDPFDNFVVEEFVASDPIPASHFDNKLFQPTMRVIFILAYHEGKIDLHFLGDYWLLPRHSLAEGGSLNEIHKAYCESPYYHKVAPETLQEVQRQLRVALPLLYRQMLQL